LKAPPFLIRVAATSDLTHVGKWLPEALIGTPVAKLLIAADAATFAVVGVAALRVFVDHVGRFTLHVDPAARRRGCGTALLDAVRETALRAGATSLMTVQSYEAAANDPESTVAQAFCQARGLRVMQEIRRCRVELQTAVTVLEPIYQRYMRRMANTQPITFVPAAKVDPNTLAAFVVRHVGGLPEAVAQRLKGYGSNVYSPTLSLVALIDNQIVAALLGVPQNHNLVETRVVDPSHRGGGLNLALMYQAAAAGVAAGIQTIDFEHDTQESDTAKLVGRLGAAQVGCRQCWGVSLSPVAPTASPPVVAQQNPPDRLSTPLSTPVGGQVREAPPPLRPPGSGSAGQVQPQLRAAHTPNFPALLRQLGASLLVTTYQAGKLVMIRDEGDHLNAHVRNFPTPMGMAIDGDRLAISTKMQVWEFANVPAVAAKLDPPGRHDACYLPRSSHFTGNIQINEMAWGIGGELWVVNTRFSCLCTLDRSASFTPRWRPPFITALEPTDRCHLNGLAMVAGKPKYVTALGETNTPSGWRENKARGGVVIDVDSGTVLARGLSIPHSPRWYAGKLWLCESGAGTFGYINPNTGKYEPIAQLPGFTRGLEFAGEFAFVGVSQVRESAAFSGIAITRLAAHERGCGVCVIDLRSGQIVALIRFETGVQEVFAVTVLGRRFPELINDDEKLLESSFVVPAECLGELGPRGLGQGPAFG